MDSGGSAGRTGGPEQKGWDFGLYFKANKGVLELQGLWRANTFQNRNGNGFGVLFVCHLKKKNRET